MNNEKAANVCMSGGSLRVATEKSKYRHANFSLAKSSSACLLQKFQGALPALRQHEAEGTTMPWV
jgi:hypothetical protein